LPPTRRILSASGAARSAPAHGAATGLGLPESDTEIVLTTQLAYEPSWLVASADAAAELVRAAGGRVISEPFDIPVGRVAVVADPFENVLVLLDLSKGCYTTDEQGMVTGVSEVRAAHAAGHEPAGPDARAS
jgi:hypothetical protein